MKLARPADQKSATVDAFYQRVIDAADLDRSIGRTMLDLIARLRALPDDRDVWALTSHYHLVLLAHDTWRSPWLVKFAAASKREYHIEWLRVDGIYEEELAESEDEAVAMILSAMDRSRGWAKPTIPTTRWEPVHTVTDFHDVPRRGVAEFEGSPHSYEAEWDEVADDYALTFRLRPISRETLTLVLEDWQIWKRWRKAFDSGQATIETHPSLPQDRERHEALREKLEPLLRIDPQDRVRALAEFRRAQPEDEYPCEVAWERM